MKLGADNGTSDGALLDDAAVVVPPGDAAGARVPVAPSSSSAQKASTIKPSITPTHVPSSNTILQQ